MNFAPHMHVYCQCHGVVRKSRKWDNQPNQIILYCLVSCCFCLLLLTTVLCWLCYVAVRGVQQRFGAGPPPPPSRPVSPKNKAAANGKAAAANGKAAAAAAPAAPSNGNGKSSAASFLGLVPGRSKPKNGNGNGKAAAEQQVVVRLPADIAAAAAAEQPSNGKRKATAADSSPVGKVKELMNVLGRR